MVLETSCNSAFTVGNHGRSKSVSRMGKQLSAIERDKLHLAAINPAAFKKAIGLDRH